MSCDVTVPDNDVILRGVPMALHGTVPCNAPKSIWMRSLSDVGKCIFQFSESDGAFLKLKNNRGCTHTWKGDDCNNFLIKFRGGKPVGFVCK